MVEKESDGGAGAGVPAPCCGVYTLEGEAGMPCGILKLPDVLKLCRV